jgi:hypothetical protein
LPQKAANQVRSAALHPAAANHRTIAVGVNSEGQLFAGSSNGFDAGQRAALENLGMTRVPGSAALHAEEELLRAVPDLQQIGTSVRAHAAGMNIIVFSSSMMHECGHLNWPRLGGFSSRIVAPPGW